MEGDIDIDFIAEVNDVLIVISLVLLPIIDCV